MTGDKKTITIQKDNNPSKNELQLSEVQWSGVKVVVTGCLPLLEDITHGVCCLSGCFVYKFFYILLVPFYIIVYMVIWYASV